MMEPEPDPELADLPPRVRKAIETRRASDAAKPKPPAKVVQFRLPFPEDTPPVCNVIARSALFAAIKSKDRRWLKEEVVATQDGVVISFTGEQFNQDDHDNFMNLVKLASARPLGEDVKIPANYILRLLGRGTGKSQHEQLKADMFRLMAGTVEIRANGLYYGGHLVDYVAQDETVPVQKRHWVYHLNPKLAALFARNQFTLNNWQTRQALGQKDLAKWLQLWLESHAQNFATGVATIRDRCGSRNASLRDFKRSLKVALDHLKAAGVIHNWVIDAGDLVHIERTPSDSQLGHIRKKTARKKLETPSRKPR